MTTKTMPPGMITMRRTTNTDGACFETRIFQMNRIWEFARFRFFSDKSEKSEFLRRHQSVLKNEKTLSWNPGRSSWPKSG